MDLVVLWGKTKVFSQFAQSGCFKAYIYEGLSGYK